MEVDVQAVGGLHLEGSLHAGGREDGDGGVAPVDGIVEAGSDLAEARLLGHLLLRVVVAGEPPGGVVARHAELGALVPDEEVDEVGLRGELIAEAKAVVVEAEAEDDAAVVGPWLAEGDAEFIVVVADVARLAPNGLPGLIERAGLCLLHLEAVHQVGLLHPLAGVLVACQFESEVRGKDDILALIGKGILRASTVEGEGEAQLPGGAVEGLGGTEGKEIKE